MMPEAVCDSQKSGVEGNVLGRLLTLICVHVLFYIKYLQLIVYLRGEVRLPGNLFPTARPRIPINTRVTAEASGRLTRRYDTAARHYSTSQRGSLVRQADVSPACSKTSKRGVRRRFVDRLSTN